jgi:hypothetical protein
VTVALVDGLYDMMIKPWSKGILRIFIYGPDASFKLNKDSFSSLQLV